MRGTAVRAGSAGNAGGTCRAAGGSRGGASAAPSPGGRGGGAVAVEAHVDAAGALVVAVSDTGVGIPALFAPSAVPGEAPAAPEAFHGVGLGNVAARLRGLYGTSDGLRIASSAGGTVATLTLPHRSAEALAG